MLATVIARSATAKRLLVEQVLAGAGAEEASRFNDTDVSAPSTCMDGGAMTGFDGFDGFNAVLEESLGSSASGMVKIATDIASATAATLGADAVALVCSPETGF